MKIKIKESCFPSRVKSIEICCDSISNEIFALQNAKISCKGELIINDLTCYFCPKCGKAVEILELE